MKKLILIGLMSVFTILTQAQNYRSNCPVKEETFTRQNPDGSALTLSVKGSELVHYFETQEGFTVLERPDGFFEYGNLDPNGNLVGSGIIVRNGESVQGKNWQPHLRYSSAQQEQMGRDFYSVNEALNKKAVGKPFPSKGNRNVLALLIQYPDLMATLPKSNFDSLMVKPNYNGTGSFRDYYLRSSFGQLNLNADVFGWFTASSGYLNYGKSNANYMSNVGNLVKRAILAADSMGVDFSKYDNDSDGYVDGIIILHAGIGAEEQSAPSANNYIWSHRSNLRNTVGAVAVDGVLVDAYGCFPEKRYSGGLYNQVGIGVLTHEFGHLLDLPDLYSTNDHGEGSGNYANMAGGPWLNSEKTPCMHDAWTRVAMGWMQAVPITSSGVYRIDKGLTDSNFAYQINTSRPNEYFLLENRQKRGQDLYLPGRGLAIWHINTNKARKLSAGGGNSVNTDTSQYGVGLLQADGRYDLEKGNNRGDGGDLYPGNTNNRSVNDFTKPNSSLHYKVGGVKQPSNISITNITLNSDSSITFSIGNNPVAGFDAIPSKGCAPLAVNFNNVSAFADKYRWRFPDGSTTTTENTQMTFDSAGNYAVTLFILDSLNQPIDSVTQTVTVDPSPVSLINVVRTDSNSFTLKSLSKDALYVVWRFGVNQSSSSPELVYKIPGSSDVPFMLIAYSSNLCTDTTFGVLSYWPLGMGESNVFSEILAWPNPFTEALNLRFELKAARQVTIRLLDVTGRKIQEWPVENRPVGTQEISLPVAGLTDGIYLLELSGEDFNKILRVQRR